MNDKDEPMILGVIDGQGGGIGAAIIKGLRKLSVKDIQIWALGTNSIATSRMVKAGANRGATGENAIKYSSARADVLIGPVAILMPNAMMGEVSPVVAEAVCSSRARKLLIPLTQENIRIVGVTGEPLPHLVDQIVEMIRDNAQWGKKND